MKSKSILILIIIAFILMSVVGTLLKIAHIGNAEVVLVIAMLLQLAVIVYFVVKNMAKKKDKIWDN